jgi:hypothetical protein
MFPALVTVQSPYADLSLSDALALGGGGIEALLRHGISAVLGATSPYVAYPLAAGGVIDLVDAAILSGDDATVQALKDTLAAYNNAEADLDANGLIPAPTLTVAGGSVAEGDGGTTTVLVTFALSGPAQGPVSATWTTVPGTAAAGSDYLSAGGTVLFPLGGATTVKVAVSVVGDTVDEPDETFGVRLADVVNAVAGTAGTVTILNDDAVPTVTVAATDGVNAEQDADPVRFSIARGPNLAGAVAVALAWGGTATRDDYTVGVSDGELSADGATLTLPDGVASIVLTLTPVAEAIGEGEKDVTLTVLPGSGYAVGSPASASGTIAGLAAAPTVPAVSVTATDGAGAEQGRDPVVFALSRDSSVGVVTVAVLWGGSASFGVDYTLSVSGGTLSADGSTLTLADGVAGASVTVTPVDDSGVEAAETVSLSLLAGSGYVLGSPVSASGSIADNDSAPPPSAPQLSVDDASVTEADHGKTTVTIVVRLSSPAASTVTVVAKTVAGSALAGKDFQAVTTTLTFQAGSTQASFIVSIVNDTTAESTETFTVVLSNASGATIADGNGVVTILDTDGRLTAVAEAPVASDAAAPTSGEIATLLAAGEAIWSSTGIDTSRFAGVSVELADLPAAQLGEADGTTILLDRDAAGWGWFAGSAPPARTAGVDLLSVLVHELGHVLGLEHGEGAMAPLLGPGRRSVSVAAYAVAAPDVRAARAAPPASPLPGAGPAASRLPWLVHGTRLLGRIELRSRWRQVHPLREPRTRKALRAQGFRQHPRRDSNPRSPG